MTAQLYLWPRREEFRLDFQLPVNYFAQGYPNPGKEEMLPFTEEGKFQKPGLARLPDSFSAGCMARNFQKAQPRLRVADQVRT